MFVKNECLIDEAKKSKKLPNIVWAIILTLIFMNIGSLIGAIGVTPLYLILNRFNIFQSNQDLLFLLITLVSFIFISLLVFIRVKFIEKRQFSSIGFNKNNWIKKYSLGFIIGILMMCAVVLILFIFGFVSLENNPTQPIGISALSGVLIILIGWIIQGATEEIVTRGWLMNILGARYNIGIGLFISSTLFGLLHLTNPNVSFIAVINIVLVGIFYGLYVIRTNDLWTVCGMHSAWNFAQGNLFGFEVSGINVEVSSLIDLNLVGNRFISGGIFGPEASLSATVVLLLSIGILTYLDKKEYFNSHSIY
ncbi:CAAX amino terminal protease self-immunity [uncultured Clostridium sp.]|nr:CAAX amino terminal protease self-immunity [uncultured Clostridium sp.]